jgi:hypothetical protein
MTDDRMLENHPDGPYRGVDRSTRGRPRSPAPRQGASPREIERFIELLVVGERRASPDIDYATARRNAEKHWEAMQRKPGLVRAMRTPAPSAGRRIAMTFTKKIPSWSVTALARRLWAAVCAAGRLSGD